MSKMKKSLCKWKKKELDSNFEDLKEIVRKPKYVCAKCGRAAGAKGYLCKPECL